VLPHLTRAVMAMDWVGSCVDYGGTPGLLALNALFVLMTEYNLYVNGSASFLRMGYES
jgi:U3 small nucleolar RNA-associated protein 19